MVYSVSKIEISELIKKTLNEVEKFYKDLLEDKNTLYNKQIKVLKNENKNILFELDIHKNEYDSLSEIISENNAIKEALKIYDLKSKEDIEIESKLSELEERLSQINDTKKIRNQIDDLIIELDEKLSNYNDMIEKYKEFIYNLFDKIYSENRNPYLKIEASSSSNRYRAMPISIDLSFAGDSGEWLSSVKYLLFDFLIMNYNREIGF